MDTSPLDKAIAAVGGETEFLARMNIKRRTLFYWRSGRLPLDRVLKISVVTGVPLHVLRPDLWPTPEEVPA